MACVSKLQNDVPDRFIVKKRKIYPDGKYALDLPLISGSL